MKISIIIATKNEEKNIGRLLKSLQKQTFKDFEIIIIDNFSEDKTTKISGKFTNKVFLKGPERTSQRNFGAQKSSGEFIMFLDADMELESKVLEDCQKAMENRQTAGIVIEEISKGKTFLAKVKSLEKKLVSPQLEAIRFFRLKDFNYIGGYDENLVSGEDWDLSKRIQKLGRLKHISSKIIHWENESIIADIKKKYYYSLHIQNYAQKHPFNFKGQASISGRLKILLKKPKIILYHPLEFVALLMLKAAQYLAYLLALIQKRYLSNLQFFLTGLRGAALFVRSNIDLLTKQASQRGIWYVVSNSLPNLIVYVGKHFFYKFFRSGRTFVFNGKKYRYFYSPYNFTYVAERSVEIPIIRSYLKKHNHQRILEVGNVLSHYFPTSHDIVDKFEKAPGVVNQDITAFEPNKIYDLIVSISTIEHVGWDEKKDKSKTISAIKKIRQLLSAKGIAILTLPIGYNSHIDKLLYQKTNPLGKVFYLKRESKDNEWKQATFKQIKNTKFNKPYPFANAIAIATIHNDKK